METVDDIIAALGGTTSTAGYFAMKYPARVSDWRRRDSIPVQHWPRLLSAAAERGVSLDYETLVRIHANRRQVAS